MVKTLSSILKSYAKHMSILIVDDDTFSLEIYQGIFGEFFAQVDTAEDGKIALQKWRANKGFDLVLTDIMMPVMNGSKLISEIRLTSPEQRILVLSGLSDLNEMRDIINLGVDGIVMKPFDQELVFSIIIRILKIIHGEKIKEQQINQLKLFAKQNVQLKHQVKADKPKDADSVKIATESKLIKKPSSLSSKYNIRKTLHGSTAHDVNSDIDYESINNIDALREELFVYEHSIVSLDKLSNREVVVKLRESAQGIHLLIDIMDRLELFSVSVSAAQNLIEFLESITEEMLVDANKKELFIDAYLALYEDIGSWINKLFIEQDTENINYFDASFANTCLEIEAIFMQEEGSDDDSDLEFF